MIKIKRTRGRPPRIRLRGQEESQQIVVPNKSTEKAHPVDLFILYALAHMTPEEKTYWLKYAKRHNVSIEEELKEGLRAWLHLHDAAYFNNKKDK